MYICAREIEFACTKKTELSVMYICAKEIGFACTKKTELSVMYICAREIGFACFSMISAACSRTVLKKRKAHVTDKR
jgi:hypothetical protein